MLSKRAKYALNALVELAKAGDEGPVSAAVLAARANVPVKFLEAILVDLRRAGIVASHKGRKGGHELRRAPDQITTAEVLRLFDGAIALVPCATHAYYERCEECVDEAVCGIRDVFLQVRAETVKLLKEATLAGIVDRERRLRTRRKRRRT
jgi:Rrf2 family protein